MATVSQTAIDSDTADQASYTFNALNIGADSGSDVIFVLVGSRTTAGGDAVSSVTVDGQAATSVVVSAFNESASVFSIAAIFSIERADLPDPSQTDVDVVITFSNTMIRCGCALAVAPNVSATAEDTASQAAGVGNLNLDVSASSVVMGVIFQGNTGDVTWVGLTEETDTNIEAGTFSTAYASDASAETPRSVDVSTSAADVSASVAASFAQNPSAYTLIAAPGAFALSGLGMEFDGPLIAGVGSITVAGGSMAFSLSSIPGYGDLTYAQAADQILSLFKTAWDVTGHEAFYESVRGQREDDQTSFAVVLLRHVSGFQATLSSSSGSRIFRREGVLTVRIYFAEGSGLQEGYSLAKVVADAYEGQRTQSGVWFKNVRVSEGGRDGAFIIINVLIDFEYDEIK